MVWIGEGSKNDFVRLTVDNESEYKAQDNILIYNDNGHDKRYRISDSVTMETTIQTLIDMMKDVEI